MFYQTFCPSDGVLCAYGRRTKSMHRAIERAKLTPGAEVRIWGTLQVVWALGTCMGEPDPVRPWWHSTAKAKGPAPVAQQPSRWPPAKVHVIGTAYTSSTIRTWKGSK
jgi:hypothetical protein